MLNFDLIKNILIVAMASSIITTALVQKIKEGINFKNSKVLIIISFGVSMILGTLFSLSFSDLGFINSLWTGLIGFIGAELVYKAFEDKIFTSFEDLKPNENITKVYRGDVDDNR